MYKVCYKGEAKPDIDTYITKYNNYVTLNDLNGKTENGRKSKSLPKKKLNNKPPHILTQAQ